MKHNIVKRELYFFQTILSIPPSRGTYMSTNLLLRFEMMNGEPVRKGGSRITLYWMGLQSAHNRL